MGLRHHPPRNGYGSGAVSGYGHNHPRYGRHPLRCHHQYACSRCRTAGSYLRTRIEQRRRTRLCCHLSARRRGRHLRNDSASQDPCEARRPHSAQPQRRGQYVYRTVRGGQSCHCGTDHRRNSADITASLYHLAHLAKRQGYRADGADRHDGERQHPRSHHT